MITTRQKIFGAFTAAAFMLSACGTPSNTSYQSYPNQNPGAVRGGLNEAFNCPPADDSCRRETGYKVRTGLGLILIGRAL